jgi:hypothetical protein
MPEERVKIPIESWTHVGSSSNAEFYVIEPELLAVVPHDECTDNETTARESLAFQTEHWQHVGHRGAAVIFMDRVLRQDEGARAVYQNETHNILTTCFALVGETFFGRVTATVFTGLTRPGVPTQVFPSLEDARPWILEANRARGGHL